MDDNVAAVVMTQSGFKHKLQFLIGEHVLPYNMTVYQAVKQFSPLVNEQHETDNESEMLLGKWLQINGQSVLKLILLLYPQATAAFGCSSTPFTIVQSRKTSQLDLGPIAPVAAAVAARPTNSSWRTAAAAEAAIAMPHPVAHIWLMPLLAPPPAHPIRPPAQVQAARNPTNPAANLCAKKRNCGTRELLRRCCRH